MLEALFCGTIPQSFRVGLEEVILNFWPLAFGFVFSTLFAWGGYQKRSLSRGGVAGAIILGTLIFGLGGWIWGLLLIAFFVSSSFLSRYKEAEKEAKGRWPKVQDDFLQSSSSSGGLYHKKGPPAREATLRHATGLGLYGC